MRLGLRMVMISIDIVHFRDSQGPRFLYGIVMIIHIVFVPYHGHDDHTWVW
jgi:hypothetical protein